MPARADLLDLGGLGLAPGEGRRLELEVAPAELQLGGLRYAARPATVAAVLDVSRTAGRGLALRLRFGAELAGPCVRCLDDAAPFVEVDAREVDQPDGGEQLDSPYVDGQLLDLQRWAHDAFALAAPDQILCSPGCLGLCPQCAVRLSEAGPDHSHPVESDPRWAKLGELRLGGEGE